MLENIPRWILLEPADVASTLASLSAGIFICSRIPCQAVETPGRGPQAVPGRGPQTVPGRPSSGRLDLGPPRAAMELGLTPGHPRLELVR